jgi:hypothetical protein
MIFSVTLSRITFPCRFPRHEPTEDAVLIGDELEVGVQLEGDVPGVPTADIDFVGLEKIVQNFEHGSHTTVPLFLPIFLSAFLPGIRCSPFSDASDGVPVQDAA